MIGKKIIGALVLCLILSSPALAQNRLNNPEFSNYPATIFVGRLMIPPYYVKSADVWRDDMGKQVAAPTVNFAGKHYVGLHSCGTECGYYTLSDLSTGKDLKALDMFSSDGEKPLKTRDGRTYITELVTRPDSAMIVARYRIDESSGHPAECRERIFTLSSDGQKVAPITGTIKGCVSR